MASFDLSFRLTLIDEIVEDDGALWTECSISCLSINIRSYQGNRVQVVDGSFCTCVGLFWGQHFKRLVDFSSF